MLGSRECRHSVCRVASLCEHWELHNTSVCHHVCLHICDFSMDVILKQSANVKFCVKLGKSGAETFEMIRRAYGNEAMSRARCFEWHARFKRGRTSLENDESSGRTSTSSAPKNVETIRRLVHEDRRRIIKDIASIVNVSYGAEQTILTCDLNIHRVAANFVPRLLTPKKKSTVLQFVKSFFSVSWMTHPLCRGSSLGTRVGSTVMIPRLNNSLRNERTQDPHDRSRRGRAAARPRACSFVFRHSRDWAP